MARKTKAQIQAERLLELDRERQQLEEERRDYDRQVKAAVKDAGFARADVVEQLYELFDIDPVTTERRLKDGRVQQVAADKTETQRSAQLMEAIGAMMDERAELAKLIEEESDGAHSSAGFDGDIEEAEHYSGGHREHQPQVAVSAQF